MISRSKARMTSPEEALPGRPEKMRVAAAHFVNGAPMQPPFVDLDIALFGLGCFWGAERKFWEAPGVCTTAVGYAGGFTENPSYEEVCSGLTGHNEVVQVVFDPATTPYPTMLAIFWESHDPTQGMQQGNDVGTQYRSGIYCHTEGQMKSAEASRDVYQGQLEKGGLGSITTEIVRAPTFYYAEDYHQQYLAKNPAGYCGLGGLGVSYPR
jgi:peptide-methionine (S)-S-oxide reductase